MNAIESSEGIQRRGLVFKMMTALKQVCNHPANYLKNYRAEPKHSGKLQLLLELLNESSVSEKIFILSLKAGGTGLNLTSAANVIHYDLWWNPAVEEQASDRAYRIGQHKNVLVQRLITKGTLEEKIDVLINSKRKLASMTVVSGEKWVGDLSNKELMELVRLQ